MLTATEVYLASRSSPNIKKVLDSFTQATTSRMSEIAEREYLISEIIDMFSTHNNFILADVLAGRRLRTLDTNKLRMATKFLYDEPR